MSAARSPLVGAAVPRREDARILRGQGRFLDDIERPGQVHAAFVRSPHARARIAAISPPPAAPGLVGFLTAADIAGRVRPFPVQVPEGATVADAGHPVLADGEARYAGQPVALVVAATRALAEDLAELVEVEYEPADAVVDPRAADERLMEWSRAGGDVEGAFARAQHVVRGRYALPRLVAAPLETRGAIAAVDADTGHLTVWCSAQDPHRPLAQLTHVLDRAEESIRIVVPDVGGAFGSKGVVGAEVAAIALAAADVGRPVKWAEDRLENFLAAYQGRGMEAEVELALGADGAMLAVRARLVADLGAYLYSVSAIPPHTTAMLMCGVYAFQAADVRLVGARTDKVPTGPYRGAGRPEAAYFLERAVDDAARATGIDPVELRRRNLVREFPHPTLLGWTYDSGDYERCLDLAVELARPPAPGDGARLTGTGIGMYVERAGGLWESADATVERSGRVVIRSGSSPHGQGHETTFAQIAADRLGVAMDDVELHFGDTAVVPKGIGTFASRSTAMGGSAIVEALDAIVAQARPVAAGLLGVDADAVTWDDGAFRAAGRSVPLREVAAAGELHASARFEAPLVFSSGAYAAGVEIDRATGVMRVVHVAAVDDGGTIVNRLLAHGQVLGGVAQGLGECLSEEAVHDENGQLTTASFADYSLLTAAEMPPIAVGVVETPSPWNPLGAKGLGEGGAIGSLPAVANAVAAALGGRSLDPPYSAEKLWRTIQELEA